MPDTLKILIANRGEIACRLNRTYQLFPLSNPTTPSISTLAIHTPSESDALHVSLADSSQELASEGPRAYLDAAAIVDVAVMHGCWGIAPGYGFLSEDATFAKLCEEKGIVFLGPTSGQLERLGNKVSARELAKSVGVPILQGTQAGSNSALNDIQSFASSVGGGGKIILKAANGGGGRGIRVLSLPTSAAERERVIAKAYESCSRQAAASFADGTVYAERFLTNAKHVEVQFLVDQEGGGFYFMEANPRIQVEHTITEQVTGVDLVSLQLLIGLGFSLSDLNLPTNSPVTTFPSKTSIQARINAESFTGNADETRPESGSISSLIWPNGGGVRIETAAHTPHPVLGEYSVNPLFDNLLAKVIVTAPTYRAAVRAAGRALEGTLIEGVKTNNAFLIALLESEEVRGGRQHIHSVQSGMKGHLAAAEKYEARAKMASKKVDTNVEAREKAEWKEEEGKAAVRSHLSGIVVKVSVKEGDKIFVGQELALIEAMKMEHVVRADSSAAGAVVQKIKIQQGGVVNASDVLFILDTSNSSTSSAADSSSTPTEIAEDPNVPRPELLEVQHRRQAISDAGRTAAVAKRHARGFRTVRENISMLIDPDSLIEYGGLALAAQKKRYTPEDLIAKTSGDGIVVAFGRISGHTVGLVMGDYLVLAGTQGCFHHHKLDRILTAILSHPAPLVLYAEGGGGRPGDTDYPSGSGLQTPSFALMGAVRASGAPVVGVTNGYVFAGNAALLGTCDVVIATKKGNPGLAGKGEVGKTSIGMGGKAMIEAGGLGVVESDDIGPTWVHAGTGGVDVVVENEDEAAVVARKLVGFFTMSKLVDGQWVYSGDVKLLRTCLPCVEERRRAFDMRRVISLLVDDESFIELAPYWGTGMITGFARIKGLSIAILANDPTSPLGGAIDINAALKAIRLLKLLARTGATHLVSLCDTPGFMVGPEFERTSTAGGSFRTFGDWFTAAAEFTQAGGRVIGLVLRRAFGLGAQAMLGGSTLSNSICASWPAGSFGPMSLEGAVQLSMKKQLAAIKDEEERKRVADETVEALYRGGRAINVASMAEIDTVLDPAETRDWLERVVGDVLGEGVASYKTRRGNAAHPHL
ncbi:hypothetical protein NDA18_005943 [Ustilago nuda]|nr:hypothetical protein NDA18_005943 [Ustilago nuda]